MNSNWFDSKHISWKVGDSSKEKLSAIRFFSFFRYKNCIGSLFFFHVILIKNERWKDFVFAEVWNKRVTNRNFSKMDFLWVNAFARTIIFHWDPFQIFIKVSIKFESAWMIWLRQIRASLICRANEFHPQKWWSGLLYAMFLLVLFVGNRSFRQKYLWKLNNNCVWMAAEKQQ